MGALSAGSAGEGRLSPLGGVRGRFGCAVPYDPCGPPSVRLVGPVGPVGPEKRNRRRSAVKPFGGGGGLSACCRSPAPASGAAPRACRCGCGP
ncbi:hypothetical protein FGF04_31515 [Streptomyces apricus]|uniref:Uncharacterized protein n=1 Tax=Streptomyces apricus TaxID=1828112 RepID=A0A5B0AGD7_9ACTN|nr:hypothetical protein FGF04_31515 [Streptomyces apricus]